MTAAGTDTAAAPIESGRAKQLPRALLLIGVVMAVVGSVGGPLITSVATTLHVSLAAAQWTLTVDEGFTAAAWIGAAITALALGISFTLRSRAAVTAAP